MVSVPLCGAMCLSFSCVLSSLVTSCNLRQRLYALVPMKIRFRLGFRCLFPFFSLFSFLRNGVLFHHDFLVPGGSGSGAGACLPSSLFFLFSGNGVLFPGSASGSGACLPSSLFFLFSGKGFCSIMICWFLLVPVLVPVLVSLLSFVRKRVLFHFYFLVSPRSGSGSGAYVPSSPFFSFSQENGFVPPRLHGSVSTQASCVPFSISSLTNELRNEQ